MNKFLSWDYSLRKKQVRHDTYVSQRRKRTELVARVPQGSPFLASEWKKEAGAEHLECSHMDIRKSDLPS